MICNVPTKSRRDMEQRQVDRDAVIAAAWEIMVFPTSEAAISGGIWQRFQRGESTGTPTGNSLEADQHQSRGCGISRVQAIHSGRTGQIIQRPASDHRGSAIRDILQRRNIAALVRTEHAFTLD